MEDCDILIVGTGIAGLSFALYLTELDPKLDIVLLSKGDIPETNTRLAQGGIAVVTDYSTDGFNSHIRDTVLAGRGLGDERIVEKVVHEAPERMIDLLRWGILFDQNESGFHLNREGGHSTHRILHHKDFTGKEIHQKLLQQVMQKTNISIGTHCFAIDVYYQENKCMGLYYYNERKAQTILMKAIIVMLATGGSGQMFQFTTNADCATGDGVAIAARAGAKIKDMHYYQFHPTALYQPDRQHTSLISEAIRGYGAHVVNRGGRRFLFDYDLRGELATRDVVTSAIFQEMDKTGVKHVYLSVKHLDNREIAYHFPSILQQCAEAGCI